MVALLISAMAAFTVAAIAHNSYRIRSVLSAGNGDVFSRQWHRWQGVQFAVFFITIGFADWQSAVIGSICFWIMFDVGVNVTAFKTKSAFYVGNSAAIDRFFKRTKHPELNMAIAKLALLLIAITVIIVF